jgi:hypothetical protein
MEPGLVGSSLLMAQAFCQDAQRVLSMIEAAASLVSSPLLFGITVNKATEKHSQCNSAPLRKAYAHYDGEHIAHTLSSMGRDTGKFKKSCTWSIECGRT